MAYAKRIYLSYKDWDDKTWTVEIYQDGYGGAASEYVAGPTPVEFRWGGNDWKNIIGSEATISILSSDDLSWLNVVTGTEIYVKILRSGSLYWSGFALPDQFTDVLNYPRYFTFTASDRLGYLNTIDYVDGSGEPYETYEKASVIIARCLQQTGLELPINDVNNLFEDDMSAAARQDPFNQLYIRQDVIVDDDLNPGSCADILGYIMRVFQCRIFQSKGEWWIWRVVESELDPLPYTIWDKDGAVQAVTASFSSGSQYATTTGASGAFALLRDATINAKPPYRDVTLTEVYGKRESIFRGWSLPDNEFEDDTTLKHWGISATSDWQRLEYNDRNILWSGGDTPFDVNKYVKTESVAVEASSNTWAVELEIGQKYANALSDLGMLIMIRLQIVGNDYYYNINTGWTQSATELYSGISVPVTDDKISKYAFTLDAFPVDGNFSIWFMQPEETGVNSYYVGSVRVQIIPDAGTAYPNETSTTFAINSANNVSLVDYPTFLADSPEAENAFAVYRGALKVGSTITDGWQLKGAGDTYTLYEWLQQWSDQNDSVYRFTGRIHGMSHFYQPIKLTEISDEVFLWTDATFNTRTLTWDGTAIQVKGVMLDGDESNQSASRAGTSGYVLPDTGDIVENPDTADNEPLTLINETGAHELTIANGDVITGIVLYSSAGATVKVGWSAGTDDILRQKSVSGSNRRGFDMFVPTPTTETSLHITITGTASVWITTQKYK